METVSNLKVEKPQSRPLVLAMSLAVVVLNCAGNLSLAWGMKHIENALGGPLDYLRVLLNPFIFGGIALQIVWVLARMALLSRADLSFVLPVTATGYILGVGLSAVVLRESVNSQVWIATLFIMTGAMIAGSAPINTNPMHASKLSGKSSD